jgi:hypothetical protein
MKRALAALAPLALAAGLTVAVVQPAQADERRCTGTIYAASIDGDVVVPAGRTCRLIGTRVDGNVKAYRGSTLVIKGARIGGNVQADNHRTVRVLARWVDNQPRRTRVGGSIQLKQGGGGEIRRAVVNGDIQLFSNDGRFTVRRNYVGGNLQCKSNQPRPVGGLNNVQGNKEDQCRNL